MTVGDEIKAGLFGEVLVRHAIGIFVEATAPKSGKGCEAKGRAKRLADMPMVSKLASLLSAVRIGYAPPRPR